MSRYLLDTNAVIAILKAPKGVVSQHLLRCSPQDVAVSSIVMHELFYGAFHSQQVQKNLAIADGLQFEVLDFDREDARHAGELRAQLALQGTPIGAYDILIAGQACARNLTLVTRNSREFKRIETLKIENWEQ